MKITVVNPPNFPFSSKGILIEPIDVLGVASYIQSIGHDVTFVDMDIKKIKPENFLDYIGNCGSVVVIVYDYHIPLHGDGTLAGVHAIAHQAKSQGAKVIVGGKVPTYKPARLLHSESSVDVVVTHEMEPALKELLSNDDWSASQLKTIQGIKYINGNEAIHATPTRTEKIDLDALPISDRSLISVDDYIEVRTMLSSRGCHLKCSFCHVPGFWGAWRARNAKVVADEIQLLVEKFDTKKILFLDDNTIVNKKRMQEISEELIEREVKVTLGTLGSFNVFDEETFALMHKAGFRWIHFGAESGDNETLQSIHKKVNTQEIKENVAKAKALGFRVRTSWILDLPDTTEESLERTFDLIMETQTDEVRLHLLSIRLGSELHDQHSDLQTSQYIHESSPNTNLTKVSTEYLVKRREDFIKQLESVGYTCVRDPDEFIDMDALRKRSPDLKIVSVCPLRYGLGWEL